MSSHIDQIKSKISISSIVSRKVSLKSRGNGEFLGICPFHHEKTPSFTVSDIKGFYHCFGCGAHGDIFSFIMENEGYDYKSALHYLADLAGVSLSDYNKIQENDNFYNIANKISEIYVNNLKMPSGSVAMNYIKNRGISDNIDRYKLGFSFLDSKIIFAELMRYFSFEEILKTNLMIKRDDGSVIDPMRGRLIFPIHNKLGQTIAFGGRSINNAQPKYLNSSENPFFEKRKVLYGMHLANTAIYKTKEVILVEGYMDVLALANIGIDNVLAPLGTALKIDQIQMLWNVVSSPTICMDADLAGQQAVMKLALDILPYINSEHGIKFININGGKDADEVIKKHGRNAMLNLINQKINLSELLFDKYVEKFKSNTPESRALLRNQLENLASKINDKVLQNEYRYFFRKKLHDQYGLKRKSKITNDAKSSINYGSMLKNDYHLNIIFYILLNNKHLLQDENIYEEFMRIDFGNEIFDKVRLCILDNNENNIANDSQVTEILRELQNDNSVISLQIQDLDPKQILIRALELHSIYIVRKQITEAEDRLMTNHSESLLSRLMSLKNYELELKKKLNII